MSVEYGTVRVSNILQRLLLLGIMTTITAAVTYRMQRLVELSGNDGLTGLPNRTLLVHRFPSLMDDARDTGCSLSVCLIDSDYFRRINDEEGHMIGDRACAMRRVYCATVWKLAIGWCAWAVKSLCW